MKIAVASQNRKEITHNPLQSGYKSQCSKLYNQLIDGRQEVKAHGPREMPVWGRAFNTETSIYFDNYPPQDSESAVHSRILALTEYLHRLQK